MSCNRARKNLEYHCRSSRWNFRHKSNFSMDIIMLVKRTRQRNRKQPTYFKAEPAGLPKSPQKKPKNPSQRIQNAYSNKSRNASIGLSSNEIPSPKCNLIEARSNKDRQSELKNSQNRVLERRQKRIKTDRTSPKEISEEKSKMNSEKTVETSRNIKDDLSTKAEEPRGSRSITELDEESDSIPQLFPASKIICEDIECGTGLAFNHWDSALKDEDEQWLDKYSDRVGIRKWVTRDRKSVKKKSSENTRYRSNFSCDGISLHLGNHRTSASAAAAIDLANILLLGTDDCKPLHVLSSVEAGIALKAAGVPGIYSDGRVEPLNEKFFTENVKNSFVKSIDNALASIGGQDDLLSSILCSLDVETVREADLHDKQEQERQQKREAKLKRRAKAQEERRKKLEENNAFVAVDESLDHNKCFLQFEGEHGLFEVDRNGKFTWIKDTDFHTNKPLFCKTKSPVKNHNEVIISSTKHVPDQSSDEVKRKCFLKSSYLITDFFPQNMTKSKNKKNCKDMRPILDSSVTERIEKKRTSPQLQEEKKFCE